ncbi:mannose-1-phosphate guanylyltransferase [Qipengyuania sp. DGS5-3]|uniref:mannose-1-phosphate guanylyltransferase n=1 Tax=Qipengyuania sp. DGS5-3 TaxID=3349632 RepID=UPI0036D31F91
MVLIHPIILCGGSGTRLWPRSRKAAPKPFLKLLGERSLFEQGLDRVADPAKFASPTIVAGAQHVALIQEQLSGVDGARLIVEPAAKNTAPAIALAAHALPEDAIMLVCPSDHHIADMGAFQEAAADAAQLASQDRLVSIGIAPTAPETGYGYIKTGEPLSPGNEVERFVEKPDLARAEAFLAEGGYVWNAGIFAFRAGAFLAELAQHRPEMAAHVEHAFAKAHQDGSNIHPNAEVFAAIEGDSIDYAVMENTAHAAVVSGAMGWSDIGNWHALMEAREAAGHADEAGNIALGNVDFADCAHVMAESDGPRISVVGLENVVVIVDGGEVLVTSLEGAQKVGKLPGATDQ